MTNYSKTEYYGSVAISIDKDLLVKNVGLFYGSGNGKVLTEDVLLASVVGPDPGENGTPILPLSADLNLNF